MAKLVKCSSSEFISMRYGCASEDIVNYMNNKINDLKNIYGENSDYVMDARNRFNRNTISVINKVKSNLDYSTDIFGKNIKRLDTVDDFRYAGSHMRDIFLSNPRIHDMVRKGRLSGWGDRRYNEEIYRDIISGLVQDEEIDVSNTHEEGSLVINVTDNESDPYTLAEKITMSENFMRLFKHLSNDNEDPTSIEGGLL